MRWALGALAGVTVLVASLAASAVDARAAACEPGSGAQLAGADLRNGREPLPRDLRCSDLSGARLDGADLTQADLTGAVLRHASLRRAVLVQAVLAGADLSGADLTGAQLDQADLTRAVLSGADLSGAELGQADLTGADLTGANLRSADLVQANLTAARLDGADVFGAGMIQATVDRASTRGLRGLFPATGVAAAAALLAVLAMVVRARPAGRSALAALPVDWRRRSVRIAAAGAATFAALWLFLSVAVGLFSPLTLPNAGGAAAALLALGLAGTVAVAARTRPRA